MEKLSEELIEKLKTNKKYLNSLKASFVLVQEYETAAFLREIEKEFHPEKEEVKLAKDYANKLSSAFAMAGIKIDNQTAFHISEIVKCYNKKKGKFSIKDVANIEAKAKEYFE